MIIDHVAVMFLSEGSGLYTICRCLGRLSFPIFVFCLVEGFKHTSNRKWMLIRLLIFGVISEVPYDLVRFKESVNLSGQNVFITLSIGYFLMMILEYIKYRSNINNNTLKTILILLTVILGTALSIFLKVDYSGVGVISIAIMYLYGADILMGSMGVNMVLICQSANEIFTVFTTPLLLMYNGKRGRNLKYFFYIFYPLHLLILWLVKVYIVG